MSTFYPHEKCPSAYIKRPASPLVSCIIPTFNEAGNIVALLRTLHALLEANQYRHELLVVDDGSRDDTVLRVLNECQELPVTLIQLSRNFGKEIALTAGIDHAQGDVAVLIDADFQHPPEMVPKFLENWREGYDMVYAVRPNRMGESLGKRLFTQVFYQLLNLGSAQQIPANTQDFRVLDRCVLDALRQMPERNRFMKGMYHWVGFSQLPVECAPSQRRTGTSSFNFSRLFGLGLTGVTAFSNMPLRVWTLVGFCISLCALLDAAWVALRVIFTDATLSGWNTLGMAISFLCGVQLLSIGILGEYIGRIFDEVKQRPTYLVRQVVHLHGEAPT